MLDLLAAVVIGSITWIASTVIAAGLMERFWPGAPRMVGLVLLIVSVALAVAAGWAVA